jgi:hypothetical protein
MAKIVLGIGTSHTPMLTLPSALWKHRAAVDYDNDALNLSDGRVLSYKDLLAEVGPRYEDEVTEAMLDRKARFCQEALDRLADALEQAAPDLVVIVGDDQSELFTPANQPTIAIFHGSDVITYHGKYADEQAPDWMKTVGQGFLLDRSYTVPGNSAFALEIIAGLMEREVDIASAARVDDAKKGGLGHAYGFIVRRLFKGRSIPIVPLLLNTYFPPNVPTPARCYDIGVKLGQSIEAAQSDLRVAVVASGGLSHFVVDEELDRAFMKALRDSDVDRLRSMPRSALRSGSSEILNWIVTAGAVRRIPIAWSEYQPVYRTPAGTGVGAAFCVWGPANEPPAER